MNSIPCDDTTSIPIAIIQKQYWGDDAFSAKDTFGASAGKSSINNRLTTDAIVALAQFMISSLFGAPLPSPAYTTTFGDASVSEADGICWDFQARNDRRHYLIYKKNHGGGLSQEECKEFKKLQSQIFSTLRARDGDRSKILSDLEALVQKRNG